MNREGTTHVVPSCIWEMQDAGYTTLDNQNPCIRYPASCILHRASLLSPEILIFILQRCI